MGCGNAKKNIENEMMIMQFERVNIQMERRKNLKLLEEMDGHKRKACVIPDYIDPQFAKEKLYYLQGTSSSPLEGENNLRDPKKKRFRRRKLKKGKKKSRKRKRRKDNEYNENNEVNDNKVNIENVDNNENNEKKDNDKENQ